MKAKVVQAAAAKVKKLSKKVEGKVGVKEVERDEFDKMAEDKQNVRQRINSGDKETKVKQRAESGSSKTKQTKQTKLNFKPVDKKPKRNPWSDVDSDEDKSGWMMDRGPAAAGLATPRRSGKDTLAMRRCTPLPTTTH